VVDRHATRPTPGQPPRKTRLQPRRV